MIELKTENLSFLLARSSRGGEGSPWPPLRRGQRGGSCAGLVRAAAEPSPTARRWTKAEQTGKPRALAGAG